MINFEDEIIISGRIENSSPVYLNIAGESVALDSNLQFEKIFKLKTI